MSNISIKSINDLLQENFYIPSYQRGYRWTNKQVKDLLEDINEFTPKEISESNNKTWYCLQPIVVKAKKDNQWDVIDGQQRLTTIYLILNYLNQGYIESRRKKLFGLKYETRENSEIYLKNELSGEKVNESNIDYYFISSAYKTICNWFIEKGEQFDINTFESKFNFSTKIIWYEASNDEDSIDIFTRINSGKIPLTNAELIKALFLNSSNFQNSDLDKLKIKQLEIASEWDRIEYALQDDAFWYFINQSDNILPTRIEFIFNVMYDAAIANDPEVEERKILNIEKTEEITERQKTQLTIQEQFGNDDYATFRFFNQKFKAYSEEEIKAIWLLIKKQYQTLEEWFVDRELYHKIGFLITIGTSIQNILKGNNEKSKSEFKFWIDEQIKKYLKNIDISAIYYGNGYVREILLLHNIQTMLDNKNESSRFPLDRFKKEHWDVEHIHAIATEVKVKKEDQAMWLKNNFVQSGNDCENSQKILEIIHNNKSIDENEFNDLIEFVLGEEDNTLQNLCLLDRGTNRSYKNDGFKEKRKKIIQRESQGTFIPICTKNLFMKYYSTDVADIEIWNEKDRTSYFKKIKEVLHKYLPEKIVANHE